MGARKIRKRVIGAYDSIREWAKGDTSFYYILFTHLGFNCEKSLHDLLRGRPCCS
jgi:hypothetical protein